jgi:hypothetical protein
MSSRPNAFDYKEAAKIAAKFCITVRLSKQYEGAKSRTFQTRESKAFQSLRLAEEYFPNQ